jgi:hypothetical protein
LRAEITEATPLGPEHPNTNGTRGNLARLDHISSHHLHSETPSFKNGEDAERYAAGETMRELAIDYEVGEATIWRALRA